MVALISASTVYCSAIGPSACTNCGRNADTNSSALGFDSATNSARRNAARPLAEASPRSATSVWVGERQITHAR